MNLNKRSALGPAWVSSAQRPLDEFINCEIALFDMNLDQDGADYNWKTNEGGQAEPTLLLTAKAQMQVYRFTLTMDAPVGSVNQVRNVRFTIRKGIDVTGVDIREGQRVFVTSCPMDPALERYQYVVNSGLNGPLSFRRTIETEVDMARVVEPLGDIPDLPPILASYPSGRLIPTDPTP